MTGCAATFRHTTEPFALPPRASVPSARNRRFPKGCAFFHATSCAYLLIRRRDGGSGPRGSAGLLLEQVADLDQNLLLGGQLRLLGRLGEAGAGGG